jgi:threonyl-tRNA synthetase
MKITLKDGSILEFESNVTVMEVAKSISEGLARVAVAAKVDGELVDLSTVLEKDCQLQIVTLKDKEGLEVYRHTTSHVLAQAVKNIFPTSKLAIGPTVENGFYYDIEFKTPINKDDLVKIENEMKAIIKSDFPIFIAGVALPQSAQQRRAPRATIRGFWRRFFFSFIISCVFLF